MFFPLTRFRVQDLSMEPTLKSGDYVLVNRWAYTFRNPVKGDLIVLKHPQDGSRFLLKRVEEVRDAEYFVAGDNTDFSQDSRHFGPIRKDLIIGKVWFHAKS